MAEIKKHNDQFKTLKDKPDNVEENTGSKISLIKITNQELNEVDLAKKLITLSKPDLKIYLVKL